LVFSYAVCYQQKQYSALLFACQAAPIRESMVRLFGVKLRFLRHQHQTSQVELARVLGLATHAHVTNLESGRRSPSLVLILCVAAYWQISTDYLLRDTMPTEQVIPAPGPVQTTAPRMFGAKLRALRQHTDRSQAQLATHLMLASHRHISHLEIGRKEPSRDLILRIAETFGVSTDYLLLDSIPLETELPA